MGSMTHLSTWVDHDTKRRFAAIANHEGMSESAMLKRIVELMLRSTSASSVLIPSDRSPRDTRVTVRLRADDQQLLRERAAAREMPAATYVSVLVRAHLRSLAPLPKEELLALRRTVLAATSIRSCAWRVKAGVLRFRTEKTSIRCSGCAKEFEITSGIS
jgi:hypothetical protein